MAMVATPPPARLPTHSASLPRLLASTQALGLERYLTRAKRGFTTLTLARLGLAWAGRGSGRPAPLALRDDPLLVALLGEARLPRARTLLRSLGHFPARALRAAVEARSRAARPRRSGRVWAAGDAQQLPYWGRGQRTRLPQGWSDGHHRRLRGSRLSLAVDTDTGQVITVVLARGRMRAARLIARIARRRRPIRGRKLAGLVADCGFTSRASVAARVKTRVPFILGCARSAPLTQRLAALSPQPQTAVRAGGAVRLGACPWDARLRLVAVGARTAGDRRGPWVAVTSLRSVGPQTRAAQYGQRWRGAQVSEDLKNGHAEDHRAGTRLHPTQVAVGCRLLARNLAIGLPIRDAGARPARIREPLAFCATAVDGLGTFPSTRRTISVQPLTPTPAARYPLPWSRRVVRVVA